ncbi:MAG TPA: choice-of-anchor Q domain-containing protein [Abditibacteriaceae bacterium]|jgi:CSLREA domain-containing protein
MQRFCFLLGALLSASVISQAQVNDAPQSGPNYVVNSLGDADDNICGTSHCTLREAINAANGDGANSAIIFDASVFAAPRKTITLGGTSLDIAADGYLKIVARQVGVAIDGNNQRRVLDIGEGADVTLIGLTISGGNAAFGGGIRNAGSLFVNNSTISGNTAPSSIGGGVLNLSRLELTNSTVSGNTASNGGGIFNESATTIVSSCTISHNISNGIVPNGGGIYNGNGTLSMGNTILNANMGGNLLGLSFSSGFNLSSDGTGPFGYRDWFNTDPRLGPLADNGGLSPTHALLPGSPAIDAGNTILSTDQRGRPRGSDFNAMPNAISDADDIGAYEAQAPANQQSGPGLVVTKTVDTNDSSCTATDCSLREAVGAANVDEKDNSITFSPSLFAAARRTITLGGAQLPEILSSGKLSITAPDVGLIINGNNQSRIFQISLNAHVDITGLTIIGGNGVSGSGFGASIGGAIYNLGTLTLTNNTISGNGTSFQGGGGIFNVGTLMLQNSTISGNTTTLQGGGILNVGTLNITNSTISNNTSYQGGGIYTEEDSVLKLANCTLSGNSASAGGGGIYNKGALQIGDTILNAGTQGVNLISDRSSITSFGYNLSSDGSGPNNGITDRLNTDPLLGPLADNGGPTQTHALLPGSPAIDTGSVVRGADQRGRLRPFDVPNVTNGSYYGSDIGAVEQGAIVSGQSGPHYVVNQTGDSDDGACSLEHCTLREAIIVANNDGVDSVISFDASVFAAPRKTITLNGTHLPSLMGVLNITAPAPGVVIDGKGQSHVFFINFDANVAMNGLTITGGNSAVYGGGISNLGTLALSDCTLSDNRAQFGGGLSNSERATATLTNCTLSGNSAGQSGGTAGSGYGGGINNSGTLRLVACTLSANHARFGGAIASGGSLELSGCKLSANSAEDVGGGIYFDYFNNGTLTASNCTISDNSAFVAGGIANIGTARLSACTLSGNKAELGGAIDNRRTLSLTNCTLSGNSVQDSGYAGASFSAFYGGAIINASNGTLTLSNCTLSGNGAENGKDIYNERGEITIGNTILNSGDNSLYGFEARTNSQGYNISIDATGPSFGSNDQINTDALLGPLADNGGPTQTHALLQGSPAINQTHNHPNTDQRGVARPQGVGGDIGAYEAIFLSIGDVTIVEGDSGTKNAVFPVTLGMAVDAPVSVNYATVNSSAQSSRDFSLNLSDSDGNTPGVLTIPAGQTAGSITVPIVGDTLDEISEVFYVLLSSPVNAAFSKARATGFINDNDAPPSFFINNVIINEGNSGTRNANFLLRLNRPSGQVVSVDVGSAVSGGSASAGVDYQFMPRTTISFTPGQTQRIISIAVLGDTSDEDNESFFVNLSNVRDATVSDNQGVGLITDDDQPPALSIGDTSIIEGNSGTKLLTFTVSLLSASGKNVSVQYATADGIARASSDYRVSSGSLNFAPGQTSKTISIIVNGDTQVEGDETVYVLLSKPINAAITRGRAMGIILNDDASG